MLVILWLKSEIWCSGKGIKRTYSSEASAKAKSTQQVDAASLAKARKLSVPVGVLAGVFGSFVGVGGGVLIVPMLTGACKALPQRLLITLRILCFTNALLSAPLHASTGRCLLFLASKSIQPWPQDTHCVDILTSQTHSERFPTYHVAQHTFNCFALDGQACSPCQISAGSGSPSVDKMGMNKPATKSCWRVKFLGD